MDDNYILCSGGSGGRMEERKAMAELDSRPYKTGYTCDKDCQSSRGQIYRCGEIRENGTMRASWISGPSTLAMRETENGSSEFILGEVDDWAGIPRDGFRGEGAWGAIVPLGLLKFSIIHVKFS
ncbi:unnamed protein product [Cuscuta europaea]|uniref:Uncharacterized protein n=1 Tax=Cuscuta europaea TaxID=41803 RepID=A0A9P0YQN0_CUSEU|nr:unnamed protein product [Cuscuta europaea]